MEGWISLHRKIKEHWLWKSQNRFQWWIDILLTVNHSKSKVLIKGTLVDCGRGQSVKSLESWAKDWNVTKKTVRDFFILLHKDNMINSENLKITTRITVCNYDSYQTVVNATETLSKRKVNATETLSKRKQHPNNNDNNEEKENNVKNDYKKTPLLKLKNSNLVNKEYFDITIAFQELFKKHLIEAGSSTLQIEKATGRWIDHVRLIIEKDKQNINSVRTVFTYLQTAEFWKKNILSTEKLREQFSRLLIEINSKNNGATKKTGATPEQVAEILAKKFAERREAQSDINL